MFPRNASGECFAQAKSAGFNAIDMRAGTDLPLDISHDTSSDW
jgi:hypothetical protein